MKHPNRDPSARSGNTKVRNSARALTAVAALSLAACTAPNQQAAPQPADTKAVVASVLPNTRLSERELSELQEYNQKHQAVAEAFAQRFANIQEQRANNVGSDKDLTVSTSKEYYEGKLGGTNPNPNGEWIALSRMVGFTSDNTTEEWDRYFTRVDFEKSPDGTPDLTKVTKVQVTMSHVTRHREGQEVDSSYTDSADPIYDYSLSSVNGEWRTDIIVREARAGGYLNKGGIDDPLDRLDDVSGSDLVDAANITIDMMIAGQEATDLLPQFASAK